MGFEHIGGECVFTCEKDQFARKTYEANFPGDSHAIEPDIRDVDASGVPDHDVLLAGFPCQPFSLAGVSKKNALGRPHGFECNTQGTLFFDIERILRKKRPRAFLLENVKNLVSHDRGKTWAIIQDALRQLDYDISPRIIDARFWVPQHRERIFIVGFDRSRFPPDLLEQYSLLQMPLPHNKPTLGEILHSVQRGAEGRFTDSNGRPDKRYYLSSQLWTYLKDYAEKHRRLGNGFGYGLVGPENVARTLSARYHKDGSEILVKGGRGRNPRRLTPRECARLMGFDTPEREFIIPDHLSDTQAYRQFGNAVVVPVVRAIAAFMRPVLLDQQLPQHRVLEPDEQLAFRLALTG